MNRIRILLADNDPVSRLTGSEQLEKAGFQVIQAASVVEAQQIMESQYIHLAILDLRLVNDSDENDRSGLRLAKQIARSLPKLIWTKFPTYQDVREALKPDSNHLPLVVDFVNKRGGIIELQKVVEEILPKHVAINWHLKLQHRGPQTLTQMLDLVDPDLEVSLIPERLVEFEDLFRKLFFTSQQITLGQLYAYGKNRVILPVYSYDENGDERQFVVLAGKQESVNAETANFDTAVSNHTHQKINRIAYSAQTNRFAGVAFAYVGSSLEDAKSLRTFAAQNEVTNTVSAIRSLFNDNLSAWYQYGRSQDAQTSLSLFLQEQIGLPACLEPEDAMQTKMAGLCTQAYSRGLPRMTVQAHQLTCHWSGTEVTTLLNPDAAWSQIEAIEPFEGVWGMIHGRVNVDTVMIDTDGAAWLIVFSKAGHGPLLWDFALLETAVKLNLFDSTNLFERYQLEERLLTASTLHDTFTRDALSEPAQTGLQIIEAIRHLAGQLAGCDLQSYQIGLIYAAFASYLPFHATTQYTLHEIMLFTHALLITAMNMGQLTNADLTAMPPQANQSLWLDKINKTVWVEGQQIALSVQEFMILAYLYENMGRLCSRKEIVEQALNEIFDELDPEQSRLNSAISRLRQKIEPDSKKPKYFMTVRGHGYKLEI